MTAGDEMRNAARLLAVTTAALVTLGGVAAHAVTPGEIQQSLEPTARTEGKGFAGFSAARGEQFFKSQHGNDWSCASCHTRSPLQAGKHAQTGKPITPLAPAANSQRFTDAAKVEKWFKRNCNDVLGRACTAQEKGDVIQYLLTLR
jgi:hypothetical protein